jgi:hypothetical protein
MTRCLLGIVLAGLLAWGLCGPTEAPAAGPFELLRGLRQPAAPDYEGNPKTISVGTPGPHRYPEYNTGNYPWYGYGFGVPTYQWGSFGVGYRSSVVSHHGYYGTYTQWGYRRGY